MKKNTITNRNVFVIKIISFLLIFVPLFQLTSTSTFGYEGEELSYGELTYRIEQEYYVRDHSGYDVGKGATIIGCSDSATDKIIIPSSINGYGVCKIDERAFFGQENITSIDIPDSVTVIDDYAFCGCKSIKEIKLPKYLWSLISPGVFADCESLEKVILPDTVLSIGEGCFSNCNSLKEVYFQGSAEEWSKVNIGSRNEILVNASVHYNCSDYNTSENAVAKIVQSVFLPEIKTPKESYKKINIPFYSDYVMYNQVTVEWKDSLFYSSPKSYNKKIAMIAGALSAAAEGENGNDGSFIRSAYKKLGISTSNISLYSYPGTPGNESEVKNEKGVKFAEDDHLAFSIGYKDISDNNGNKTHLILITARGTKTTQEGYMDGVQSGNSSVLGYKTYDWDTDFYEDILVGLQHYIGKHSELKTDNVKFLVSGHSLGGAAANLVAADLTKNEGKYSLNYKASDVFGYTYGAINPLVNDSVETGYENIHNIYNYLDSFGPKGKGYDGLMPAGHEYYNNKFGTMRTFSYDNRIYHDVAKKDILGNSTANHDMPGYLYAVACNMPQKRNYCLVCCPVDVDIYSGGELVGQIKDNIINTDVTTIPCALIDDAKMFILDEESSYEIRYTATDSGSMKVVYGNTGPEGTTKEFVDIVLKKDKTMVTDITANEAINDYSVYVTDESGNKTAEIAQDGKENLINSSFWHRIIQWIKNLFSRFIKDNTNPL